MQNFGKFSIFKYSPQFDCRMAAFVDCLSQLQTAMLQRPGQEGFALPYKMGEKGRIEDPTSQKSYSIKSVLILT